MSQSSAAILSPGRRSLVEFAAITAAIGLTSAPISTGFDRVHLSLLGWLAVFIAVAAGGWAAWRSCPAPRSRAGAIVLYCWLGACAVIAARVATYPAALQISAFVAGAGIGALARWGQYARPANSSGSALAPLGMVAWMAFFAGLLIGQLVLPRLPIAAHAAAVCAAVTAVVMLSGPSTDRRRWWWALPWIALALFSLGWVGATNPRVSWLGPVTSHGPRDRNQVALTFDDGPNGEATLAVMQALDARGVKGTFFLVGKAVNREPELAQRIIADGHLVGNHSSAHDGWRFIQPGYPELARGERAIRAATGVCPRYYRPPHGTHTPFVWLAARDHHMRVVNWDVSAQDWIASDAAELARRIVERARPGSIILLHDGIDGIAAVDRSVLVAALPAIIDGLRAKGLEPVRLDALLNESGTLAGCT